MPVPLFEIDDLCVRSISDGTRPVNEILHGVSLRVQEGEMHAIVGPGGGGKSTLASTLLGSPEYEVTTGRILLRGDDVTTWGADVRAKAGLFLAFRDPQEVPGVSVSELLRLALSSRTAIETSVSEFRRSLTGWMEKLDIEPSFAERHLNASFSGIDRKRSEILQMAMLEPEMAILDLETDAGLDANSVRSLSRGVNTVRSERPGLGTLAIIRDQRFLDHLQPDVVHVLTDGLVAAIGDMELAGRLEDNGYESFR